MPLSAPSPYDALLDPAGRALVAKAAAFAAQHVAPHAQRWEDERHPAVDALRLACAEGLAEIELAADWGGPGLPYIAKLAAVEAIAYHDMAFAFSLVNHHNALVRIARDAARDHVAPLIARMRRGEMIGCTALTEPGAGSDFAAIATRAERNGAGWVLNGEKAWITNAAICDVAICYAQTDPGAGWRGIAAFLVRADRPGFVRQPPFRLQGGHAIGAGGFRLENYAAEAADLLQPPGAGFKSAMTGINGARTYVAGMCCAMLEAGLATAVRYATARRTFGQRLIDHQGLRWSLVDAATDLEAARLLTRQAAQAIQDGADAVIPAAHAKRFAVPAAERHLAACIQAMGAEGLRAHHPLGRHLANAKLCAFTDGSTEIQNERIGRDLERRFAAAG